MLIPWTLPLVNIDHRLKVIKLMEQKPGDLCQSRPGTAEQNRDGQEHLQTQGWAISSRAGRKQKRCTSHLMVNDANYRPLINIRAEPCSSASIQDVRRKPSGSEPGTGFSKAEIFTPLKSESDPNNSCWKRVRNVRFRSFLRKISIKSLSSSRRCSFV